MSIPLPLIVAGVAGAYLLTGSKKRSKSTPNGSGLCVPDIAFSYVDIPMTTQDGASIPTAAIRGNDAGEKNSIVLAKATLAPFMPERCMGSSSVMVTVKDGEETAVLSAPALVFVMATKIAVELSGIGRYTLGEKADQIQNLSNWWSQVSPGQPEPIA